MGKTLKDALLEACEVDGSDSIPNRRTWLEHATIWYPLPITEPSIIVPSSGTPVIYTVFAVEPAAFSITNAEYQSSIQGMVFLDTPGCWWLNFQPAGSIATRITFTIVPVKTMMGIFFQLLAKGFTIPVELYLGGTVQSALDVTALLATMTWSPPAVDTPTASNAEALAADTTRRLLYIKNTSTGGQVVSLGFGQTSVLYSGMTLNPGELVILSWPDSRCVTAVNRIASATGGRLSIQVGTV